MDLYMVKAVARHILVKSDIECMALKRQIKDGEDFAEVAKGFSDCHSAKNGGSLGAFRPGMMVKEFDEVCFTAPVGEVLGPVKTPFGYHLIEVIERQD
jgi:peptidyl-prolyl cis-trans isomerase C